MYKLAFFIPKENKEYVKDALFNIGVGRYNNYDKCSFETLGTGQYRPLDGAKPFIGTVDDIEILQEYKVEIICQDSLIKEAIKTLKKHHPYEEVAYEVFKLEDF